MARELMRIGYWRGRDTSEAGVDPTLLVGCHLTPTEREGVAAYLRAGAEWCTYRGFSFCRFACGVPDSALGSRDLTDGVWVWPEGLPHYVTAHEVCLPEQFLRHVRSHRFGLDAATILRAEGATVTDDVWLAWAADRGAFRAAGAV